MPAPKNPVIHLELLTSNMPRALGFYTRLFGWETDPIETGCGTYMGLGVGNGIDGGVVECERDESLWLPYVEVPSITEATDRARMLGAEVRMEPREGPAGWRSVIAPPGGPQIALWQRKEPREEGG